MGKVDLQKLHKNCERAGERWSNGACKHCFQYLIAITGIPTLGIPYDWSIVTVYIN